MSDLALVTSYTALVFKTNKHVAIWTLIHLVTSEHFSPDLKITSMLN